MFMHKMETASTETGYEEHRMDLKGRLNHVFCGPVSHISDRPQPAGSRN
jgi:hypothetical protein